jgi:uncharacterized protein YndB with AHSA1/START domain
MNDYRRTLDIAAAAATVYAALTTAAGLRGWWSQDCDIASGVGGELQFRFGRNRKVMRIERLDPPAEIRWSCTDCYMAATELTRRDEWIGTQIVFRLRECGENLTRLEFEHIGLVPALECYDLCSDGWDYFLPSLQQFAQTGRGTPFQIAQAVAA